MSSAIDWQAREDAALNAAVESRRHLRGCAVCGAGGELCDPGRALVAATHRALGELGDRFAARGRAARAL